MKTSRFLFLSLITVSLFTMLACSDSKAKDQDPNAETTEQEEAKQRMADLEAENGTVYNLDDFTVDNSSFILKMGMNKEGAVWVVLDNKNNQEHIPLINGMAIAHVKSKKDQVITFKIPESLQSQNKINLLFLNEGSKKRSKVYNIKMDYPNKKIVLND